MPKIANAILITAAKYPPLKAIYMDSLQHLRAALVTLELALILTHIPEYPANPEQKAPNKKEPASKRPMANPPTGTSSIS